jgi:hypothetical protein
VTQRIVADVAAVAAAEVETRVEWRCERLLEAAAVVPIHDTGGHDRRNRAERRCKPATPDRKRELPHGCELGLLPVLQPGTARSLLATIHISHALTMFVVTEAQAAMIRATYEQRGELSAAPAVPWH